MSCKLIVTCDHSDCSVKVVINEVSKSKTLAMVEKCLSDGWIFDNMGDTNDDCFDYCPKCAAILYGLKTGSR